MDKYNLIKIPKVGLLSLIALSTLLGAKVVVAETTDASTQKLPENREISKEAFADPNSEESSALVQQVSSSKTQESETASYGINTLHEKISNVSQQSNIQSTEKEAIGEASTSAIGEATPKAIANGAPTEAIPSSVEPAKVDNIQPIGQINQVSQLEEIPASDSLDQITNVTQLRDVKPSDWAYEALRSLIDRYGCIAGYPDRTFRGNRAMSRYEFAAGLNSCLQQIEKVIATRVSGFATKQDLATIQRLVEDFRPELTKLGTRLNNLEGRIALLEDRQFSTTTKLSGQVIMSGVGATGGAPNGRDANIILVDRVRLNLQTSFTGKDTLITGLQAYNFGGSVLTGAGSTQATLFPGSALTSGMSKLSFEPQFPGFNPKDLSTVGANSVNIYKLLYIFPVAKKLTLFVGPAAEVSDAFPAVTPFANEGQDAISRFAGYNPVVRVSGGTSGTGLASAGGFIWSISDKLDLRALYGSVNANIPGNAADVLPRVSGTPLGSGLFSGSSVVAAQLTIKPTNFIDIGLNYANSYHQINILGIGSAKSDANALGGVGLGIPVKLNSLGATATWRVTPNIAFSGYGAYIFVKDSSSSLNASSDFTSWMVGLHFNDLIKRGNAAGIIFGQPLFRTAASGAASLKDDPAIRRGTPYHLEAYYRFKVTDNISITPGAFVLFNPEGDKRNDTTTVGVLRTTFTF